ncbi:hypothetical protein EV426DRAFT_701102 [Tirmania nivea]|nr:hypothetical protein EV426DRAFT_701102 [Tirmania nivea]
MPLPAESPFTQALKRFQNGLTSKEIDDFKATTIANVWDKACELQREQSRRGSMQNMARIRPFIDGLTKYSGVIEVFVQAEPDIMAFIWGPLKFLLQIASRFADHFEKLLDAFQNIGENLPRFQTYEKIFQYDHRLQEVIALVYEDIMEFLRRTWKFFRRRVFPAWHIFFDSVWDDFDGRFKFILDRLSRHKELLDKQAIVSEIQEAGTARKAYHEKMDNINDMLIAEIRKAEKARKLAEAEIKKADHERNVRQGRAVIDWLHGIAVEDDQERYSGHRHPGTGKWLFLREEFIDWCNGDSKTLWLTGKPGCGKTILASTLIEELQSARKQQVLYFFCDYRDMSKNTLHTILRVFTTQFLQQNPDILPVASQWPEQSGLPRASLKALKQHFKDLVQSSIEPVYLILDGLDECDDNPNDNQQQLIQNYFRELVTNTNHGPPIYIRVCILSREIRLEDKFMELIGRKIIIDKISNGSDIHNYLVSELNQAKIQLEKQRGIILPDVYLSKVAGLLAEKAKGMFLWTRLIIGSLLRVTTFQEFKENLYNLPEGLDQAYGRILQRIQCSPKDNEQQQILRIIKWLACSCRPVTLPEVESWLVVDPDGNRRERPQLKELYSSLLIEILPDTRVQFIHFSVKQLSGQLLPNVDRHKSSQFVV